MLTYQGRRAGCHPLGLMPLNWISLQLGLTWAKECCEWVDATDLSALRHCPWILYWGFWLSHGCSVLPVAHTALGMKGIDSHLKGMPA